MSFRNLSFLGALILICPAAVSYAGDGGLLATGGATSVEGSAGGGITTWAVLAGYATEGESSAEVFLGWADTGNFSLSSAGVTGNFHDRVELSWARQTFRLGDLGVVLGAPGARLEQDIFGAKVRLAGDVVYSRIPQVSVGVQYKRNLDFGLPSALGALDDSDYDLYAGVSRAFLGAVAGRNLLVNLTVRRTRANELGLLGFGGDANDDYEFHPEGSIALFLDPGVVAGIEYRSKPSNLSFSDEDDWADLFIGWFPSKRIGVVAAITDLGTIATLADQGGIYLSLQATF